MKNPVRARTELQEPDEAQPRRKRADAQLKMGAVVQVATEVFAASGVNAPVRVIAEKAGVGLGTVYRHFPQRSDLIAGRDADTGGCMRRCGIGTCQEV